MNNCFKSPFTDTFDGIVSVSQFSRPKWRNSILNTTADIVGGFRKRIEITAEDLIVIIRIT
jgi:hypothetical protein